MTGLFRAELLKLWTVTAPKVLLICAAVVATFSATAQIAIIEANEGDPSLSAGQVAGLIAGSAAAIPLALFIGVVGSTNDIRHRTEYLNHLVSPVRWRFTTARLGAYVLFGLTFSAALLVALLTVMFAWALLRVGTIPWGPEATRITAGVGLATSAYTAIGLAVGSIFRNQIVAVGFVAVWMFALEGLLLLPLALVDLRWTSVLPIQAIQALLLDDALEGTGIGAISFGAWPTAAIILAWTVLLTTAGVVRSLTADID